MTRFAKIPEEILETLPVRLVGRYAWLAMHADWDSGKVPASSWSEAAALMRCSDRAARDALRDMSNAGAVNLEVGEDGRFVTLRVDVNRGVNRGVNRITPIIQKDQNIHGEVGEAAKRVWFNFTRGYYGSGSQPQGQVRKMLEAQVADAAERGVDLERAVAAAVAVGERYREASGATPPRSREGIARLWLSCECGEASEREMTNEEWLRS